MLVWLELVAAAERERRRRLLVAKAPPARVLVLVLPRVGVAVEGTCGGRRWRIWIWIEEVVGGARSGGGERMEVVRERESVTASKISEFLSPLVPDRV